MDTVQSPGSAASTARSRSAIGALHDDYLARDRCSARPVLLWEIGPDGAT